MAELAEADCGDYIGLIGVALPTQSGREVVDTAAYTFVKLSQFEQFC